MKFVNGAVVGVIHADSEIRFGDGKNVVLGSGPVLGKSSTDGA